MFPAGIERDQSYEMGYQGVRNVSFSEYFACVINEWPIKQCALSPFQYAKTQKRYCTIFPSGHMTWTQTNSNSSPKQF